MLSQLAEITNQRRIPVGHTKRGRNSALVPAALLLLVVFTDCRMTQQPEPTSPQQNANRQQDPLSIHRRAIAIDMHADTTQRLLDEQVDLSQRLADGHFDSIRAQEGGLDAQ